MSPHQDIGIIFCLMLITSALRLADYLYYKDNNRILEILNLRISNVYGKKSYYKRYDSLFAIFPFLWSWIDITIAALLISIAHNFFVSILAIIFIGAKFRALQEASHTALHYGLCKSKVWQWEISNIFFQYPCFKVDMHYRYIYHVIEHHKHANELRYDPNIKRFISIGFLPGITSLKFYTMLFYPLTLAGFKETILTILQNVFRNQKISHLITRIVVAFIVIGYFYLLFGLKVLLIAYFIPLITIYPLFSWISLLAEHRWFVECKATNRRERECINGRPTDYAGVLGWFIKHFIFPGTDHYHLVHSLYPFVRWNYMRAIDAALKEQEPSYSVYLSKGLLYARDKYPSALSELRDRLTKLDAPDLADWARTLSLGISKTPFDKNIVIGDLNDKIK